MKKTEIYEIAIKLFGLYIFINILQQLFEFALVFWSANALFNLRSIYELSNSPFSLPITVFVVGGFGLLISIFVSWLMIFKTKIIVTRISSQSDLERTLSPFPKQELIYEFAIIISGIVLIASAIPEFTFKSISYIRQLKHSDSIRPSIYISLVPSALKLVIGIFALVAGKRFAVHLGKDKNNIEAATETVS
jgi:hypothetical protein